MAWLHAVYFLDQHRGWIAGSNGTLLQTTDGGATWTKLKAPRDNLRDLYFFNDRDGWLLVQRDPLKIKSNEKISYLLSTNDGGATWRQVFLETADANTQFTRLLFTDENHGWVFGETGVVFATSDGGAHWTSQRSATKHLLLGGAFANAGRGLLVGAGATIMQSEDGLSWSLSTAGHMESTRLNAAAIVGPYRWVAGNAGEMFASFDGGRSWSRQRSNVDANLFDLRFIDAREGWAVGAQGTLLHTTDGGLHWILVTTQSFAALERLCIVDRDHVWAVGFGGTILSLTQSSEPRLK
jgi:photosystem II stability/assembly factor-like uncharacterized protein